MALDLRLVHDFTHSVPGALPELPHQLEQPPVHLLRKACYLLFNILFALDGGVLIRIVAQCFGGILAGGRPSGAEERLQRERVLRGLLGVRCRVGLVDDHCWGFV